MIGLGLGFGHNSGAVAYSAEAEALFAAMSVQPDATRKTLINACINSLKTDGVWARLDWLSLVAAHDAQAGRVNWINPAQVATAVASPTFTTDRGYAGDGISSYLNTGWNPASAPSPKFVQDDACMFAWSRTNSTGTATLMGNVNARFNARNASDQAVYRLNEVTNTLVSGQTDSRGLALINRAVSTTKGFSKNGAALVTGAVASTGVANSPFLVCANNADTAGGVTPANQSTQEIAVFGWGQSLNNTQIAALYSALNTYLTAVGAA